MYDDNLFVRINNPLIENCYPLEVVLDKNTEIYYVNVICYIKDGFTIEANSNNHLYTNIYITFRNKSSWRVNVTTENKQIDAVITTLNSESNDLSIILNLKNNDICENINYKYGDTLAVLQVYKYEESLTNSIKFKNGSSCQLNFQNEQLIEQYVPNSTLQYTNFFQNLNYSNTCPRNVTINKDDGELGEIINNTIKYNPQLYRSRVMTKIPIIPIIHEL